MSFVKFFVYFQIVIFSSFSFSMSKSRDRRPDVGLEMMNAYRSGCDLVGSWSGAALSQIQSFIGIVETLKSTDACKSYSNELGFIQEVSQSTQSILQNDEYREFRKNEERLYQLTLAIQGTEAQNDTAYLSFLQQELFQTQLDLTMSKAKYDASIGAEKRERFQNNTLLLSQKMNSLLRTVSAMRSSPTIGDCLQQSPSASLQLGLNMLSYGGSFLSPVYGAGTAIVAELISLGVESQRQKPYDEAVFRSQMAIMPMALSCGLQSLSNYYCSAEDTKNLLKFRKSYSPNEPSGRIHEGIEIISNQFPELTRWLEKVKNGIPPQDPFQADRQNQVREKLSQAEISGSKFFGFTKDQFFQYETTNDQALRKNIILKAVGGISIILTGSASVGLVSNSNSSTTSPYLDFENSANVWACKLLEGKDAQPGGICPDDSVRDQGGQIIGKMDISIYLRDFLFKDFSQIEKYYSNFQKNWNDLYSAVLSQVYLQYSNTIQNNQHILIAEVFENTNFEEKISPYLALKNIEKHLVNIKNRWKNNIQFVESLNIVLEKTKKISWILSAKNGEKKEFELDPNQPHLGKVTVESCPGYGSSDLGNQSNTTVVTSEDCNRYKLGVVFELLKLNLGVQVYSEEVNKYILWDLQKRVDAGEFPRNISDLLRTSSQEITGKLNVVAPGRSYELEKDLSFAQILTSDHLVQFRRLFQNLFRISVEELAKNRNRDAATESILGELCALWSTTADFSNQKVSNFYPNQKVKEICESSSLQWTANSTVGNSGRKKSISIRSWNQDIEKMKYSERMCSYYQLRRKIRLEDFYLQSL